ncbi:MAG: extracellular solute-binding protein [Lachnospiraceae bacterium]|nr:extracellular solute-binding protein [Lachnospiraceae bacterium]
MRTMKKAIALLLVAVMVLSLAACGKKQEEQKSELAGEYTITVWVADAAVDLTKEQIEKFNETNEDGIKFVATIENVSEADAGTNMITDVEAGGDLYCFAQDQFARLVQAGALAKLGTAAAETVKAANDAGVVAAATSGEEMYAYPLTADNGYFMYYDKSVIPDADVDSLEKILEDCEKANKYFAMETNTSAWYLAGFFFGTGCVSEWVTDDDGSFTSVNDTFNSTNGLIAAKGIKKLVDSKANLSSSEAASFASNAAVVVTGTWAYEDIKSMLGDNMGVTDLPSFEVDGKQYHIGSFNGCKLMGVKPSTDAHKQAALHKLAQYLTGEACQMERFEKLSWGPSNINDQKSEAVQSNPALAALILQSPYSVPQGQIHGSWWDIAKVIADDIKDAKDDAGLQAALDNYSKKMNELFNMDDSVKNAWTVIGAVGGSNWDKDFPMNEVDGKWKLAEPMELKAGDEFKVRKGLNWDDAFPAENFVVEADGTYTIVLDPATGEVTLEN